MDCERISIFDICQSLIMPNYNLTYQEADELIDYRPPQELDIYHLSKLLSRRREWRKKQGALLLDQHEGRI